MAEENSSRYLPEELQEKILVRLPVKSIVRFESVSKAWLSMFHSRRFIDFFGRRHPGRDSRTIYHADILDIFPALGKRESKRRSIRILGPLSNGIYCLTSHAHYKSCDDRFSTPAILSGKIALYNPAIRHHKFIDPFPCEFHPLLSQISSKPCRLHFGFGFGSGSALNDYRVVVLVNYDENPHLRHPFIRWSYSSFLVFVYNYNVRGGGGGEWKKIVDYQPGKRNVGHTKATEAFSGSIHGRRIIVISNPLEVCPQKIFDGCFHWMAIGEAEGDEFYVVLSFNFVDESFKLIDAPPRHWDYDRVDELLHQMAEVFVLHDHLAVIKILQVLSPRGVAKRCVEVNVWMMMEYGVEESWTKIYTISPNNLCVNFYRLYGIEHCPQQSGGIRIKGIFFQDGIKQQIISCKDGGHKVVGLYGPANHFCWNTSGISTYIETLERF